jgi:hypothetical protein
MPTLAGATSGTPWAYKRPPQPANARILRAVATTVNLPRLSDGNETPIASSVAACGARKATPSLARERSIGTTVTMRSERQPVARHGSGFHLFEPFPMRPLGSILVDGVGDSKVSKIRECM